MSARDLGLTGNTVDIGTLFIEQARSSAVDELDERDLVSQDQLLGQAEHLEFFHWFAGALLEDPSGRLRASG